MPGKVRHRMGYFLWVLLVWSAATMEITSHVTVAQAGEMDDLTCSSPTVLKIVRKLAKQDFMQKVGAPNRLYDVVKAVRTQAPGLCLATYDYKFGPPHGFYGRRSKGDFMDWFGDKVELFYDFQVTDDKKDVVVHVTGLNWNEAPYGLPRPEEQR